MQTGIFNHALIAVKIALFAMDQMNGIACNARELALDFIITMILNNFYVRINVK